MKYAALVSVLLVACGGGGGDGGDDGSGSGSDDTNLDIGCWNLRMFESVALAPRIAELIESANLDVVTFEEIESQNAFDAIISALPGWQGELLAPLGSATGGIGIAWDGAALTDMGHETVLQPTAANPRPVVRATFSVDGTLIDLYAVHLKAGTQPADEQARVDGNAALEPIVRTRHDAGHPLALVLGDFNEDLHDTRSTDVFRPWDPARYTMLDTQLAANGGITFLPANIMLDHMFATKEMPDVSPEIPTWAMDMSDYETAVSDHLPLLLHIPRASLAP
ncbi:MAG TPA: endonuclease/exonuclease/phosphatase family protein [Kofleriaceae bacterium]